MPNAVVLFFIVAALIALRPWRTDDDEWFHASALFIALLLGGLLMSLA